MILDKIKKFFSSNKLKEDSFTSELIDREELEKVIGAKITNPSLYVKALTHRSYLDRYPEIKKSNERLEFLGDSVLGLIAAEYLFKTYKSEEEGFLTKSRSLLVNKEALSRAAELMNLKKYILYERKFINSSVSGLKTINADALEALIGAVYLDTGLTAAEKFVSKKIFKPLLKSNILENDRNYKGQLLEFAHSLKIKSPYYKLIKEEGPEHNKKFFISVFIDDQLYGEGKGKNKKTAEQLAAKIALQKLKEEHSSLTNQI